MKDIECPKCGNSIDASEKICRRCSYSRKTKDYTDYENSEQYYRENAPKLRKKRIWTYSIISIVALVLILIVDQSNKPIVLALYFWVCSFINVQFNKEEKYAWHDNPDLPEPYRTLSTNLVRKTAWDIYAWPAILFGIGVMIFWVNSTY